jgi:hypothetical protein
LTIDERCQPSPTCWLSRTPAGDANNEDGWSVSVEVEEKDVLRELKKTSCYGVAEKKKTLSKCLVLKHRAEEH